MKSINANELFVVPNPLNYQRSHYIRFGEKDISKVMLDDSLQSESLFYQVQKNDRKFTYHVDATPQTLIPRMNNKRPYQIHVNLESSATNIDTLEAYYFARVLDQNLQQHELTKEGLRADEHNEQIVQAIKATEYHF